VSKSIAVWQPRDTSRGRVGTSESSNPSSQTLQRRITVTLAAVAVVEELFADAHRFGQLLGKRTKRFLHRLGQLLAYLHILDEGNALGNLREGVDIEDQLTPWIGVIRWNFPQTHLSINRNADAVTVKEMNHIPVTHHRFPFDSEREPIARSLRPVERRGRFTGEIHCEMVIVEMNPQICLV
jgi:hypothetical protein